MYNTLSIPTNFTFRKSWLKAINQVRAKSTRNRILTAIINYAFNHEFTLTGNSTIDSLMILIADQIDTELNRPTNIKEPEPEPQPEPQLNPQPPVGACESEPEKPNTNNINTKIKSNIPQIHNHPKISNQIPLHILRGRAPKLNSRHHIRKHHNKHRRG